MTHLLLKTYVSTQTAFSSLANSISFAPQDARKEEGAETVQVIMIMGIMAIIVVAVMTTLGGGIKGLGNTVKSCITKITGGDPSAACTWGGGDGT